MSFYTQKYYIGLSLCFNIAPIFVSDELPYTHEGSGREKHDEGVKIYDNMFIFRVVLSLLMGLIALFVGLYTLFKQLCEQQYAEPVGRSKLIG